MKVYVQEEDAGLSWPWQEFIATAEGATWFLSPEWTSAVSRLLQQPVKRIMARSGDGEILAGLIVSIRHSHGFVLARKPWATPYCGPAFAARLAYSARLKIANAMADHLSASYDYVRIDTGPAFGNLLSFQRPRWNLNLRNTYRLRPERFKLELHVEPSLRRHIKKIEQKKLTIGPGDDPRPLFDMYCELYKDQGASLPFDFEAFQAFCKSLLHQDKAVLWYVHSQREPIAGMLITRFRGYHYYSLSAFRREFAAMAGPTLLLYSYIERAVRPGETFDFVGANADTPGITAFKSKFNPCECPYVALEYKSWRYHLCEPLLPILRFGRRLWPREPQLEKAHPLRPSISKVL